MTGMTRHVPRALVLGPFGCAYVAAVTLLYVVNFVAHSPWLPLVVWALLSPAGMIWPLAFYSLAYATAVTTNPVASVVAYGLLILHPAAFAYVNAIVVSATARGVRTLWRASRPGRSASGPDS
ncbi:MAG: hypothetical protein EPO13_07100 [Actinomycetota bacterium]|nr:MAG: hypothetical protein EPO13_07100 [Actinomycetota bacterium]